VAPSENLTVVQSEKIEKDAGCQFCTKKVVLDLVPGPQPVPAWRMFDCPHCHRTNFILLDAQIQSVRAAHE